MTKEEKGERLKEEFERAKVWAARLKKVVSFTPRTTAKVFQRLALIVKITVVLKQIERTHYLISSQPTSISFEKGGLYHL